MRSINMKRSIFAASILMLAIAGCGGGGGGGSSDPTPHPINKPPSITILSPTENPVTLDTKQSKTLTIRTRVDDPDGGNVSLVATWDGGLVSPSEKTVSAGSEVEMVYTAPNYDGQVEVNLIVNDGEASAQKSVRINVTGNNIIPDTQLRITDMSVSPVPVKPGETATITATVNNPEGKTLTYKWTTISGKVTGSGASATWTAPLNPGIYGVYLEVSDEINKVKTGIPVTVSEGQGGLLGDYYKTDRENNFVRLTTKVFSRIDPGVNFNWMDLSPDISKLPSDGFGVKWTGFFKVPQAGTYQFRVHVDDGAKLRIMDDAEKWVSVIPDNSENWADHDKGAWLPSTPIPVTLDGGKWYPIELQYFEGGGNAFITLYWSINGGSEVIVPQSMLKPTAD